MNRKFLYLAIFIALVIAFSFGFREFFTPNYIAESPQLLVMGTFARVVAIAQNQKTADRCIQTAFEKLQYVDRTMSGHDSDSQLSKVNREAFEKPVCVDQTLFEVIASAADYSKKTDGAFDITIGPVIELWRDAEKTGKKPTDEQIAAAHKKVGSEKLTLDPEKKTIRFKVQGMTLDLGGIAKGYAIDLAIKAMRQNGAMGGMVDVGGDIRCFGVSKNPKQPWRIGLQDPENNGNILMILQIDDMAVATSGDYQRFVIINGEKYSHIINPATSFSAKDFSSVSVISKTAIDADALATAVTVMGIEKGLELIESLPQTEAILIDSNHPEKIIKTSGADCYTKE